MSKKIKLFQNLDLANNKNYYILLKINKILLIPKHRKTLIGTIKDAENEYDLNIDLNNIENNNVNNSINNISNINKDEEESSENNCEENEKEINKIIKNSNNINNKII